MIAVEQVHTTGEHMLGAVRKWMMARRDSERRQRGIVGDTAEGQDRRVAPQPRELGGEIAIALPDLRRQWLVRRWQALHRVGDARIDEAQAVIDRGRCGRRGIAKLEQRRIQQDASIVAGKRAPARVGAVHAGRQPDDDQPRGRIAKGRHRTAEVPRICFADFVKEAGEPRTAAAIGVVIYGDGARDSNLAASYLTHVKWRASCADPPLPLRVRQIEF